MTAPPPPLVTATGICKSFGRREVLHDVQIEVRSGEIVALIGPNGSGKSTLARILLGILPPTSGTVARRPGLRVGYVPQRLPIDIVLPLPVHRLLTLTARATRAQMRDVLEEVGAPNLLDEAAQNLSGGELQRVLIARALLRALAGDPALEVPSPTFTLVQTYAAGRLPVAHFDLYRIAAADELLEIGLEEALEQPLGVPRLTLVEMDRDHRERKRGTPLNPPQQVEQGKRILAAADAHHHVVVGFQQFEVVARLRQKSAQAFLETGLRHWCHFPDCARRRTTRRTCSRSKGFSSRG